MTSFAHTKPISKPISYLENHAARLSEELAHHGGPVVITQNGVASMVIEGFQQFQEKESLIAALKIMAQGEQHRLQDQGISAQESRRQLKVARQKPE